MAYLDNVYAVVQIAPTGIPTYVRLSQNENGRVLNFAVSGDALPAGSTVALTGTKPDGAVYSASGTLADNVATFNEDEQLTAVAGEWDAKVEVTNSGNLIATGRIKFVIDADPSGGNIPSDSQLDGYIAEMLSMLDAGKAEAYGSPLVASTVAGMIDQSRVYVYTGSETGYTAGNWYYWNGSAWTSGGVYNSVAINTDTTLSVAGMAADAKATGEALNGLDTRLDAAEEDITAIKDDLEQIQEEIDEFSGGLTPAIKEALLNCFAHVGWDHDSDKSYYDALEEALYADEVNHITASFTPGTHEVYPTDSIESLRHFLVVTAVYNDETEAIVEDYALEGDISSTGAKTITVKYGRNKTATFSVTVVTNSTGLLYEWDFTKSLTDFRQYKTAVLQGGEPQLDQSTDDPPVRDSSGVIFDGYRQNIELFDVDYVVNTNLFGKTIQVDVSSFNYALQDDYNNRFILFAQAAGTTDYPDYKAFDSGLVFRRGSGNGWSFYNGTEWKSAIYTGMSARSDISGKTVGLYLSSTGAGKLYINGSSKGVSNNALNVSTKYGLRIGGANTGANNSMFYDAVIAGVRIYNGEVA